MVNKNKYFSFKKNLAFYNIQGNCIHCLLIKSDKDM